MVGWTSSSGELMGYPTVAIPPLLQHDSRDVFGQLLVLIDSLTAQRVNRPGPADIVQLAEATDRHQWMRDTRIWDHLVPFFEGYVASGFIRIEFSRASWPQYRSNSAVRSSALRSVLAPSVNAAPPRSSTSLRHQ